MTTELTKAAQQALEPMTILSDDDILRAAESWREFDAPDGVDPVGRMIYGACRSALNEYLRRARQSIALTQRPAAQTEREAFEAWFDDYYDKACAEFGGIDCTDPKGIAEDAWQAHASLPAPQQATPEPDDAQRRFEAGCVVLEYLRDIGAPYRAVHHMLIALHGDPEAKSKATPEPVGEALQFPPMPEGWPARFRCDSCDGNGEVGELVSMGHFQPPERQTCPDCGGRGWTSEEPAFNAEHMREFAETHARCTRPAPGVPEGFALVPVEPTPEMKAAGINVEVYSEASDSIGALTWAEVAEIYRSMLAAAQAKGADK